MDGRIKAESGMHIEPYNGGQVSIRGG